MASAVPVPEQPGRLFIPATGSVVQQDQQYEGDYYDTVEFQTFAVGSKQDVFKVQQGSNGQSKELHHTNLTQTKRIPSYSKIKLQRVGIHVRQWAGSSRPSPEDVVALYECANFRFTLGQTNLVAEGPLLVFQSGLGVAGISNANNFSALTLGVASQAAAPRLLEQADINDKIDLNARIQIDSQLWMGVDNGQPVMVGTLGGAQHILASVFLHGIINRPLGS